MVPADATSSRKTLGVLSPQFSADVEAPDDAADREQPRAHHRLAQQPEDWCLERQVRGRLQSQQRCQGASSGLTDFLQ